MKPTGFLDFLPIWAIYLLSPVFGLMAVEIGHQIAKYWQRRANGRTEAPSAPIVASTLGLFAFLLAFTFGSAASRFEERKQAVLAESSAIESAYLRAAALPEPVNSDSRRILREYVDLRVSGVTTAQLEQTIAKSELMQKQLWDNAVAAANAKSGTAALFMTSLNDVINLHHKRVTAGLYNRLPATIWIALYSLLLLGMTTFGYYETVSGTRRSLIVIGLVIAFSLVLGLIADLDRPGKGRLEVSQQTLVDLQKSMNTP